jgi:hypothetical protein
LISYYNRDAIKQYIEKRKMLSLIGRLANVSRKPVTIGGEVVLYRPTEDRTVMDEIRYKGKLAVPYLIRSMKDENERIDIRNCCVILLGDIPSKEGLSALIYEVSHLLPEDGSKKTLKRIHYSLNKLTGMGGILPPMKQGKFDIDATQKLWGDWWNNNKDKLVDIDKGIGLKNDDGTITPLPLKEK